LSFGFDLKFVLWILDLFIQNLFNFIYYLAWRKMRLDNIIINAQRQAFLHFLFLAQISQGNYFYIGQRRIFLYLLQNLKAVNFWQDNIQ